MTEELETFSEDQKNLNRKIDISALGSVQEIITSIAQQTKINITIDPAIQQNIVSNFTKVKVKELLLYLCRQYDLDLKFTGSIISVVPYQTPVKPPTLKELGVYYNKYNSTISLDLKNDTLSNVARKIAQQSGNNIIISPKAQNQKVNGFVDKQPIKNALKFLAKSNGLYLTETAEGAFFLRTDAEVPLEELDAIKQKKNLIIGGGVNYEAIENLALTVKLDSINDEYRMDIQAINVPFVQIIKGVSIEMGKDYFLFEAQGTGATRGATNNPAQNNRSNRQRNGNKGATAGGISLKLEDVTYEEFLNYILRGTSLTYKIDNDIYLIGDREMEGLRQTKTIQLQYRSAKEIEKLIPKELQDNVAMYPFLELNA